jgi:hypothetical protein
MRISTCIVLTALTIPFAGFGCGGAAQPAKGSDQAAASAQSPAPSPESSPARPGAAAAQAAEPGASPTARAGGSVAPASGPGRDYGATGDIPTSKDDDPWLAAHQMSPGDVLSTIRAHQAKAQACFREGLKRDPSTNGEVRIRFVITHDGVVRDWRDDNSSMTDEDVTKCVGQLVKGLHFPTQKSPGDAWGSYRVNFSP